MDGMAASDDELLVGIGARVAEIRSRAGLTQEDLAEAVGVSPVTLSRWERGHAALGLARLALVADALGVGLGDLLDHNRPLPTADGLRRLQTRWVRLSERDQRAVLALIDALLRGE